MVSVESAFAPTNCAAEMPAFVDAFRDLGRPASDVLSLTTPAALPEIGRRPAPSRADALKAFVAPWPFVLHDAFLAALRKAGEARSFSCRESQPETSQVLANGMFRDLCPRSDFVE